MFAAAGIFEVEALGDDASMPALRRRYRLIPPGKAGRPPTEAALRKSHEDRKRPLRRRQRADAIPTLFPDDEC